MKYTKQYFIEKFQAIPDENWTTGELTNQKNPCCHCALGHCGVLDPHTYEMTNEAISLGKLLVPQFKKGDMIETIYEINDNMHELGETPKQRILNALNLVPDETP